MARITKKDIYAGYNIEYKSDHINTPYGWKPPLLKTGNEKTGEKCYTYSMPAGTAGTCVCNCKDCYAMTGCFRWKSVKESLQLNQDLTENHLDFVKRAIMAQIEADHITMVRIHAAGDFNVKNSESYAKMWQEIVAAFPSVKFWTYTKMHQYENLFDQFDNANIVPSVLPFNLGFNFGTCEKIIEMYEMMKRHGIEPHICECGVDDDHHCQDCAGCSVNKYVLFILHSSDSYNAKVDPLLPKVAEIIESQKAV